jgi:endonuclease/exonuclease/phosphatase family metal-dependent hydrolase
MRLASVNLNKRMRNPAAHARLAAWLCDQNVDVLTAQEPWKAADGAPVSLGCYRHAAGDARLSGWIHERWAMVPVTRPDAFVQRLELGWLVAFNVYLDAYAGAVRAAQLRRLRDLALAENGRPALLIGDFNLAPRPADGRFGEQPSTSTSRAERESLRELLTAARLVDATAADPPEFTFGRMINGRAYKFRCDLALLSARLQATARITYDHSVRIGATHFTDHSAILADLRQSLPPA